MSEISVPSRTVGWLAYRGLLVVLALISVAGALSGRSGDWLMLAVVANGALALHGCIAEQGFFRPAFWRLAFWIDCLGVLSYAIILVSDNSAGGSWAMLLIVAVLFYPMLHAVRAYAWHLPQYWNE